MTSFLWILLLANLLGTPIAQDLNLADAFGDGDIPPTKPPVKPAPPKNSSPDDFDLAGALDFDDPEKPAVNPPKEDPKKPTGDGFDLSDALGPDTEPKKPVVKPPEGGGTVSGGGNLDDKDLLDVMDGEDGYKPDGGKSGGRAAVSEHEGGASDQPQDLNQQWLHLMRILADTMPEGLSVWIANLKDVVVPLLERVMQLLNVADEKTEL
ncbi:CD99 molecule isoform X2 [Triplophysa dalaica]|uniref:CD99 molecule isoform X2 n=1 Tax=Triplophysa dalaica TaxID=1582913 RepID=UPI0024DF4BDA|nr:CD99 molecule isoform X2 [Triplophysa dalaica]